VRRREEEGGRRGKRGEPNSVVVLRTWPTKVEMNIAQTPL
jgi:hypothetical protein